MGTFKPGLIGQILMYFNVRFDQSLPIGDKIKRNVATSLPIIAGLKVPMSHYQVLASPSHLEGPYFSMKTSGNRLWWHLWSQKWLRFNGEKSQKMKSNFKVVVLDQNFAFFGLKPNDIKQRSWFWPKIPISQHLSQLDWRHLENQNKSQKCTFW